MILDCKIWSAMTQGRLLLAKGARASLTVVMKQASLVNILPGAPPRLLLLLLLLMFLLLLLLQLLLPSNAAADDASAAAAAAAAVAASAPATPAG